MSHIDSKEVLSSEDFTELCNCINYLAWSGQIQQPFGYAVHRVKGKWLVAIWPMYESARRDPKTGEAQLVNDFGLRKLYRAKDILSDGNAAMRELMQAMEESPLTKKLEN